MVSFVSTCFVLNSVEGFVNKWPGVVKSPPPILVQYSDKFMHTIVLYSIVLRRSQLYCIVNLLLCGYNTIQWCA